MNVRFQEQLNSEVQELDLSQPVINIGGHPENDIVLTGADVLTFHATLIAQDHQFQLIALGSPSSIRIDGAPLTASPASLTPGQRLEIGKHSLAFTPHNGLGGVRVKVLSTATGSTVPQPEVQTNTYQGDSPILVNVVGQAAEIEVEQTAYFDLEIINGGQIVAGFSVSVTGVPEAWITVAPRLVNLNEGQRATVRVSVTPPRESTSTAGKHTLVATVQSSNYPGVRAVTELGFTIKPYYDFSVGGLSPKQQNIFWGRKMGVTGLPISNHGNSTADFSVSAVDDENGCTFDFVLDKDKQVTRQAILNVPAGTTTKLPIEITPLKQPMVSMRVRRYHYTATIQLTQQALAPQTLSGTVTTIPLIGWWSIVLTTILLLVGLFFLVQPRIHNFAVASGKDVIEKGDTTRLTWRVSPFATRLSISNVEQALKYGQTSLTIAPPQSTTYELVAGNWLSGLLGLDRRELLTVLVVPPTPNINVFEVDSTEVAQGVPVTVRWSVTRADQAFLTIDEVVYELKPEEFSGERSVVVPKDALVTMEAKNASGSQLRSYFINVVPPNIRVNSFTVWVRPQGTASLSSPNVTATSQGGGLEFAPLKAPPDPNFPEEYVGLVPDRSSDSGYRVEFYQPDRELAKGEQIMLEWNVLGVDKEKVEIAPFTEALPARGVQPFFPQESMNFVMTAKSGDLEKLYMLPVKVFDGTPPVAPKIEFFKGSPLSMLGAGNVQFAWSVSGEWTRVQLSTEGAVVADNLNPQGFRTVRVDKSTTFILTAWNGELSSAAPLEIVVNPSLIPVTLTIKDVLPSDRDRFMIGDSVTVQTEFGPLPVGKPKPTGQIIVTDGVATCTITLPATACDLKFKSPGNPVQIKASYLGDTIYLQADSPAFTGRFITVTSAVATLTPTYYRLVVPGNTAGTLIPSISGNPLQLDEGLFVRMQVKAVGAVIPVDNKGQITVSICTKDPTQNVIVPGSCTFLPTVATVQVDPSTGVGTADIVISNLPKAGNPVLLFEYRHADNAISPSSYTEYGVTVLKMQIALGLNICTNPTNFSGCTTGVTNASNTTITFDILKALGNVPLSSALPQPVSSHFQVFEVDAGNNKVKDWTCSVVLATTATGGVHKLQCQADLSGKTSVNVRFAYLNTSTPNNYYMSTNPNQTYFGTPFGITIKLGTNISLDMLALQGVRAGQNVPLTPPGVIKLALADAVGTPITNSTGQITLSGPTGIMGIVPGTSAQNCSLAAAGATDEIRITAINSNCPIFFTQAGTFDLTVAFAGDGNYNASSSTATVTISKQLEVSFNWQSSTNGTTYSNWNVVSIVNGTNLYGRIQLGGPTGFSPAAMQGQILQLTLTRTAGSCSLTVGATTTTVNTSATVDIPLSFTGNTAFADFRVNCNTVGAQVTLDADLKANNSFAVAANQPMSKSFFIVNQARGNVSMNVNFIRQADNAGTVPSLQDLYVGELYRVQITVGVLWADAWTGAFYPTIQSAVDYYIYNKYAGDVTGTSVAINLPLAVRNRIDWSKSNCESTPGARDLVVRMDRHNTFWVSYTDVTADTGISDIEIYNQTACSLAFLTGQEVTQSGSAVFIYSAIAPNYAFPVSVPSTYSTNGLIRQMPTLAANPALSGTGWINFPVTYDLTVTPQITTPSNSPIDTTKTFDDFFAVSLPQSCSVNVTSKQLLSGTTARFTLTPTAACNTGLIEVLYKGNEWYYSRTIQSTAINFQAQTATTITTPASSLNPSTYGANVTLSATVSPASATGTVEFKEGSTVFCSDSTLTSGAASCTTNSIPVGGHSITATYTSDTGAFTGSTSAVALTQTVTKANPTFSLSPASPASIVVGNSITITASVTGSAGASAPTGTLTFTDTTTSTTLCSNVSLSTPCTPSPNLAVGSHAITVTYSGDSNYNTASQGLTVNVNKATPTVTAPAPSPAATTILVGDSISFSSTVSGVAGVSAPTGTVDFMDGATTVCGNLALGSTCGPITTLAAGTHSITAVYSGDANYNTRTSTALTITVNKHSSSASGLELENPANTWSAFPFNTTSTRAAISPTSHKLRTTVTDSDTPAHTTLIPSGSVEIWVWNTTDNSIITNTNYTITQVTGEGAVTYDGTTNHYSVALNSSGVAVFTINFNNTAPNNKDLVIRYQYNGSSTFSSDPLSTATPTYKVSPTFRVQ